ncbi:hypothetical protein FLT15_10470 [Paenibacillus thiaminolyticus]|uniref:hypothetical protein n=1 Tax=Paenibacillus thiaminolyticus TaxID=49283 RepID=UPI001162368C|nr:hypothetical protein [Paenibacillus thiaminolyticus]NGP58135.1 hypothetical protein [Paenibacillus thiaminolyticus]NGP58779.1 hypothetical protein [Paenibacillus thiaminolyticus]
MLSFTERDTLAFDSIARIRLVQPILKADLIRHVATISDDGKEEILFGIEEYFGLSLAEEIH